MSKESFEEFWFQEFRSQYVEDGNWQKYTLKRAEVGGSPKDRDKLWFEEAACYLCEETWNHQQKKIEELEKKLEKELVESQKDTDAISLKNRQIRELKKQNQDFREALEFYADRKKYITVCKRVGNEEWYEHPLENDSGEVARQALEKAEGEG